MPNRPLANGIIYFYIHFTYPKNSVFLKKDDKIRCTTMMDKKNPNTYSIKQAFTCRKMTHKQAFTCIIINQI